MIGVQHWPLWLSLGALAILVVVGGVSLVVHLWRGRDGAKNRLPDPG